MEAERMRDEQARMLAIAASTPVPEPASTVEAASLELIGVSGDADDKDTV